MLVFRNFLLVVTDKFGGNRSSRLVLLILSSIREARNDCSNSESLSLLTHFRPEQNLQEEAILQALIMMRSSIRLSLISPIKKRKNFSLSFTQKNLPAADWIMYTSSPRTDSPISTFVSWNTTCLSCSLNLLDTLLENFFEEALLTSSWSRSQILAVRAGWEEPENTCNRAFHSDSPFERLPWCWASWQDRTPSLAFSKRSIQRERALV